MNRELEYLSSSGCCDNNCSILPPSSKALGVEAGPSLERIYSSSIHNDKIIYEGKALVV
jgi:hypothetical protein